MDQPGLAARSPRAPWWRLALAFWLVAQLAVAALLLHADRLPPVNDEFHYYAAGRRLAAAVSAFLSTAEPGPLAAALVDGATHRPNGLALWGAAWSAVLPPAPQMARLLSFFFLALLVFAIRDVGARLFGEPAGSLAAFVLSTCPLAFGHARLFMANLPATAMAAAAAAALLRSERFARLGPSLVVGAFFGAGMLLRLDFPVEAAAALGAAVLALPGGEAVPLARRARNALAAAGVALALCGPWYAVNGPSAWRFFSEAGAFAREFDGAEATAAGGALYYAREVYRSGLWQPYTAILLLALPLALPRLARRPAAALLFWTLAPLLFQAIFVAPRVRRFLMPALPPLALLLAAAVMALRAGWPRTDSPAAPGFPVGGVGGWGRGIRELARRALAPGVVAVGVAQFLFLSFVPGAAARFRPLEENQSSRAELRINNGLFKPDARDWGVARLDAMILPWARRLSRETRLAFIDVRPETSCGFDLLCLEGSGRPPVRSEALRGQTRPAPAVAPREIFTGGDLPDIVVVSRYRRDHVHGLFDVPSLDGVEAAFRARASEYLFLGEFEVGPDRCFVYVR